MANRTTTRFGLMSRRFNRKLRQLKSMDVEFRGQIRKPTHVGSDASNGGKPYVKFSGKLDTRADLSNVELLVCINGAIMPLAKWLLS